MNCKRALEIIYLPDETEITQEEKIEFINHLSICGPCREEARGAELLVESVIRLKAYKPFFGSESEFTGNVMREIRVNAESGKMKLLFENFLFGASFKAAFSSILIFFVSLFLFQEFDAIRKIENLENRNNIRGITDLTGAISFTPLYKIFHFIKGTPEYDELTTNWILIEKREIRKLLAEFGDYIQRNSAQPYLSESALLPLVLNLDGDELQKNLDDKNKLLTKIIPVFPGGEHKK